MFSTPPNRSRCDSRWQEPLTFGSVGSDGGAFTDGGAFHVLGGKNYWFGAEEAGLSPAEDTAAWETTRNLNDVPLALNFIIFLSSVN